MREKVIFFGNGRLAETALEVIQRECEVIFHVRTKEDLARAMELKQKCPEAHGILASYGVMIGTSVLEAFEPEGILNIHPSLLPKYRGASPIESAIIAGDKAFSVSVMKLVKAMDAGPIYYQKTLTGVEIGEMTETEVCDGVPTDKWVIYDVLARTGTEWIVSHLAALPEGRAQDEAQATFCGKLDKTMSELKPENETASQILRKIIAFQGYPKPKYAFWGVKCIILEAYIPEQGDQTYACENGLRKATRVSQGANLAIPCSDGEIIVTRLQPEGRKAMEAKAFINGYAKR